MERPSAFGDLPALDPTSLLCLEIDIELRDAWELLDLAEEPGDDLPLGIIAWAMRLAYASGRYRGETEGYRDGYEDGRRQDRYAAPFADAPA
jgi:hypothetical protein